MATGTRRRYDFQRGTLGADLGAVATTITFTTAPGFATLTGNEYIPLTIDDGTNREIVHLTAYTEGATTGTVQRAQEGTTAVAFTSGANWRHGPTTQDFDPANEENKWYDELREWRVALAKRPRGEESSATRTIEPPSILLMGDSITEGDGADVYDDAFPHQFAEALYKIFGQVGEYIPTTQGAAGMDHPNPWTHSAGTAAEQKFALGGRGVLLDAGEYVEIDVTNINRAQILHTQGNGTGIFQVNIDGVSQGTFDTNTGGPANTHRVWETPLFTGTTMRVVSNSGTVYIEGALLIKNANTTAGVTDKSPQLWVAAHHGWSIYRHINGEDGTGTAYNWQMDEGIRPDLIIIALGAGDFLGARTAAQAQADLATMIDGFRSDIATRDPSFLFIKEPYNDPAWPAYVDALEQTARAKGCAILDMETTLNLSANSAYLTSDGVHLNEIGQTMFLDQLLDFLPLPRF